MKKLPTEAQILFNKMQREVDAKIGRSRLREVPAIMITQVKFCQYEEASRRVTFSG